MGVLLLLLLLHICSAAATTTTTTPAVRQELKSKVEKGAAKTAELEKKKDLPEQSLE